MDLQSDILRLDKPSQSQSVFNQSSHCCADRCAHSVSDLECDFVEVRLDIFETGVENVVHLRLCWHLWKVFVAVYHFHHIYHLLAQLFSYFLPADLSLLLIGQVDDINFDAPNFPGNAFVWERPTGLLLLVEFQGNLAHAVAARVAQSILKLRRGGHEAS